MPSYPNVGIVPTSGQVNKNGYAVTSLPNKAQASMTPQHIREIVVNGDPADMRKHKAVFWSRGRYARRIKPEYAWILLAKGADGNPLVAEEKLAIALPDYQRLLRATEEPEQQSNSSQGLVEPLVSIPAKGLEYKDSSAVLHDKLLELNNNHEAHWP
jgi:hypothetical protein